MDLGLFFFKNCWWSHGANLRKFFSLWATACCHSNSVSTKGENFLCPPTTPSPVTRHPYSSPVIHHPPPTTHQPPSIIHHPSSIIHHSQPPNSIMDYHLPHLSLFASTSVGQNFPWGVLGLGQQPIIIEQMDDAAEFSASIGPEITFQCLLIVVGPWSTAQWKFALCVDFLTVEYEHSTYFS